MGLRLVAGIALVLFNWDTLCKAGSGVSDFNILGMADIIGFATDGVKPWAGIAGAGLVEADRALTDECGDRELKEEL